MNNANLPPLGILADDQFEEGLTVDRTVAFASVRKGTWKTIPYSEEVSELITGVCSPHRRYAKFRKLFRQCIENYIADKHTLGWEKTELRTLLDPSSDRLVTDFSVERGEMHAFLAHFVDGRRCRAIMTADLNETEGYLSAQITNNLVGWLRMISQCEHGIPKS